MWTVCGGVPSGRPFPLQVSGGEALNIFLSIYHIFMAMETFFIIILPFRTSQLSFEHVTTVSEYMTVE